MSITRFFMKLKDLIFLCIRRFLIILFICRDFLVCLLQANTSFLYLFGKKIDLTTQVQLYWVILLKLCEYIFYSVILKIQYFDSFC